MKTLRIVAAAALFVSAVQFQAPARADSDEDRIDALLHQSGYTYEKRAAGVWVVPQTGKSLGDFKVIVAQGEGLVVIFVIVAKKDQMDMGLGLATRMLSLNHEFDRVKVGTDDDGDAFVRLDASLRSMDGTEMQEDIHQVAASADEAYDDMKPYLH